MNPSSHAATEPEEHPGAHVPQRGAMRQLARTLLRPLPCLLVAAASAWCSVAAADTTAPGASASTSSSAATAAPAAAAAAERTDIEPATLRLLNRDIVTLRAVVAGATPQRRVEQAVARIRQLPDAAMDLALRALPFEFDGMKGVQFMIGDTRLFAVHEGDVDRVHGQTLDALARQTLERLEQYRRAWHDTRDGPLLLTGLAQAAAATLGLAALVWGVLAGTRRTVRWLEEARGRLAARRGGVDWRELLARLAAGSIQIVQWLALLLLGYLWLRLVLAGFVATQPLAEEMDDWFRDRLAWVARGVLDGLPGIVTVIIVLVLTRALADVLGYFFDAVQQGRLTLPLLHRETTTATRRIVTVVVWGLGIAIAYPYLPGSSSDAFKGLSVLAGVMLTLGSSGLVTQAMSGLVVIYSRALRKGDFVEVNGVQGVVTEVASLAIKMINVRNEEITIPNSVLVSSPIHNYSKLAETHGTLLTAKVTIGYDAPWRQVHAMLEEAARRTPRVRQQPAPYVYQRALSDFYVEYELFVGIEKATERVPVQSALHASIQDVFNEHGVQIMSPHFLGQPAEAVVVPRTDWYKAPARPPA
jgi:small-conductance mechanosensitive channel